MRNSKYPFSGYTFYVASYETTFASGAGFSTQTLTDLSSVSAGDDVFLPRLIPDGGLTNLQYRWLVEGQSFNVCVAGGQFGPTAPPRLFEGTIQGRLRDAGKSGRELPEGPSCFDGPADHAQNVDFAAFVGRKDGPLMDRWMFGSR